MGETIFPKAAMNTNNEDASSSQNAAAHPTARVSSWRSARNWPEAFGHAMHLDGDLVPVEERDMRRPPSDDLDRTLAPSGQRDHHRGEEAHEHDPGPGGHGVQRVVAVEEHRHQQRRPQDGVEHQRGAHALHAQREAGVGSRHAGLGEQAVGDGRPRCGAPRHDVAHGQARQVDPQQAGATRALVVQHGVGELAVGHPRRGLEDDAGDHVGDVDPSQQVHGLAGAGELRQDQVLEDEDEADRVEPPFDLSAHPPTPGRRLRPSPPSGHASTSACPARAISVAAAAAGGARRRGPAVPRSASPQLPCLGQCRTLPRHR